MEKNDVSETDQSVVPPDVAMSRFLGALGRLADAATSVVKAELDDTPSGMVEAFRQELVERRDCLVGAEATLKMVRDTLASAESLELARTSLTAAVAERIALVEQAIEQTDLALDR